MKNQVLPKILTEKQFFEELILLYKKERVEGAIKNGRYCNKCETIFDTKELFLQHSEEDCLTNQVLEI